MEQSTLSEYLVMANKYFQEELERTNNYLYWDIKDKLLEKFREEMLVKN